MMFEKVLFVDDRLTILPHSSSSASYQYIGVPVSVREFSNGEPVHIEQCSESGDYRFIVNQRSSTRAMDWVEGKLFFTENNY